LGLVRIPAPVGQPGHLRLQIFVGSTSIFKGEPKDSWFLKILFIFMRDLLFITTK
jgi:hypothetical protein